MQVQETAPSVASAEKPRILVEIKRQTQPHHDSIEENPFGKALMDGTMPREQYVTFLQKFYGFHLALEAVLGEFTEWARYELDFDKRRKVESLRKDLRVLGMSDAEIDSLPICKDLPTVQMFAQALGAMYVMEGSTLGGQIQGRQVKKLFDYSPETGAAYFSSYGAMVGMMWKEFCGVLVAASTDEQIEQTMIEAASETFNALERWLRA